MKSETKAQRFNVPTRIDKAADDAATRYSIDNVKILPRKDGVFLLATDSRGLAIVEAEGHVGAPTLLPAGLLETAAKSDCWISEEEGSWGFSGIGGERFKAVNERFPTFAQSLPKRGKQTVITLDARLLRRIAAAVTCMGDLDSKKLAVTIIVGGPDQPIGVIGSGGIGAVMPLGEDEQTREDALKRYDALRKELLNAEADEAK